MYFVNSSSAPVAQTVSVKNNLADSVVFWGKHNTFPEQIKQYLYNSGTAAACVKKYQNFIYGKGVVDDELANLSVNPEQSLDDFFNLVALEVAIWDAAAVHITTNLLGQPLEYRLVPYWMLRKGVEGSEYDGKYLISNNWNQQSADYYTNKKPVAVDSFSFNALENIAKIEACEGEHKGFILEFNLQNHLIYPLPTFISVLEDVKADAGASMYRSSSAENAFNPSAIVVVDGQSVKAEDLLDALQDAQGYDNADKLIVVEGGIQNENTGKFEPQISILTPDFKTDLSREQEAAAKEKILNCFEQHKVLHSVSDNNIFGQSGEALKVAFQLYNLSTERVRKKTGIFINDLIGMLPDSIDLPDFKPEPLTFNV